MVPLHALQSVKNLSAPDGSAPSFNQTPPKIVVFIEDGGILYN
jgi:hypothetical protein